MQEEFQQSSLLFSAHIPNLNKNPKVMEMQPTGHVQGQDHAPCVCVCVKEMF